MKQDKIAYYLKTLHRVLNIPIVYGVSNSTMHHFQPFILTAGENELDFIIKRLQRVFTKFSSEHAMYFIHPSMVMMGLVMNHATNEFVFVGPVASSSTTEKDISDYLFELGLSADTSRKMSNYMNTVKSFTLNVLQELLVNINTVINDEILSTNEIIAVYDNESKNRIDFAKIQFTAEAHRIEQQNTVLVEEYNKKLDHCVINGDLDSLSDLLNNIDEIPFLESSHDNSIKELKIIAFGSVFHVEMLALKSGIPQADLDRTKQYYLNRIDSSRSADDIHQLTISSLFDFTKHVKEYLARKTENPTINRAINYIKTNINSKILAEDIANALHVNLHYLFTKFKSETGETLTQYINNEKVKKACYYLQFTDKSLVDVAVYLSFSSQSYFQNVFKKIIGQTPTAWRKNNTYIK